MSQDSEAGTARAAPPARGEEGLRIEWAGLLLCAILAATWTWWALKEGAYFGVVLLPGGLVLCATTVALARSAPWGVRLRPPSPAGVALLALLALGAWAALSALWSPAPAAAIADGQRILIYALAFALGLWLVDLLRSRPNLALIPLAVAGAVAGIVTVVALSTGDDPSRYLESDETLEYPLGYRNANAAFFVIALFPALGLAADRGLDWRIRGAALATATLCIDLALLSQSRGSVPAAVIACGVYLLVAPLRLRALVWLLLAAVPALGVLPALTDLYQAEGSTGIVDAMNAAGIATAVTAAVAAALGALAARLERGRPAAAGAARSNRAIAIAMTALVAAGAIAFVIRVNDPADWISQRAEEFSSGESDLSGESSRFTFQIGSDRSDIWRVALEAARDHPIQGDGAGGFQYAYARERDSEEQDARDAHGIELEVLAELGAIGLAILVVGLGAIAVGALRGRGSDPATATISAIALTSGAYWLAHGSIDWFLHYPALTAPTIALLGSACAAASRRDPRPRAPHRSWIVAGVVVLAISLVPPYLSERYVNDAYAGWRDDLDRAYDELDRAATLNPWSDAPLLAEGAIAQAVGDSERALEALQEAAERVPDEWATHYLLAEVAAPDQPELASRELEIARRLNPNNDEVDDLREALDDPAELRRLRRQRTEPEDPE